jgi:two-component system, LuxR family, sensor kinase FixL
MAGLASQIKESVGRALEQTRGLSRGLVPIDVSQGGLRLALEDLAAGVEQAAPVRCAVLFEGEPGPGDPALATHLFRIAQEAVSNSLRHGNASIITIKLVLGPRGGLLAIEDNGTGLPPDLPGRGGMGLRSMRYRADVIGAAFHIGARTEGGVIVTCRYP